MAGRRVLVTRAARRGDPLVAALSDLGADVIWLPTIRIAPPADAAALDRAADRLAGGRYDWVVFTSANAVAPVAERAGPLPAAVRICAIGPATVAALARAGWRVDCVPAAASAEAVVDALGDALADVAGRRILFPKADIARPVVEAGLAARGATVDAVVAYRTLVADPDPAALRRLEDGVDVATFTSGSAVRNLAAMAGDARPGGLPGLLRGARIACIGPETAQAAESLGLPVDILAVEPTVAGLVDAIVADMEPGE